MDNLLKLLTKQEISVKRCCHGKDRDGGGGYQWYVPPGEIVSHDSRCDYCWRNGIVNPDSKLHPSSVCRINCDSAVSKSLFQVDFGGFRVWVTRACDSSIV